MPYLEDMAPTWKQRVCRTRNLARRRIESLIFKHLHARAVKPRDVFRFLCLTVSNSNQYREAFSEIGFRILSFADLERR